MVSAGDPETSKFGKGTGLATTASVFRPFALASIAFAALGVGHNAARADGRSGPEPVPFAESGGLVGSMARSVSESIDRVFGVDVRQVATHVLDQRGFDAAYARVGGRPTGSRRRGGRFLMGFEYRGEVYLKNTLFKVNREVVIHELLHAVSQRFADEAAQRGRRNLIEGVTDYLTHRVIAPQQAGRMQSAYRGYERFAALLARRVGQKHLERCYFERGYRALVRRAGAVLGPERFRRAVNRLEANDVDGASALLQRSTRDQAAFSRAPKRRRAGGRR